MRIDRDIESEATGPAGEELAAKVNPQQLMLMGLIFFATALNYVDRQVLALLKPTLEAQFHWSNSDFANLGTAFQLATVLALFFIGWFVDRFGVRLAYGAAVALWSLAGIGHALSRTIAQFVAARVALAVTESVNTPAAVKAAAMYMPLAARSLSVGLINTAPNIGAILTPLVVPALALAYGWRAAFIVTGSLGFIWLIFWIAGTRNLRPLHAPTAARPLHAPTAARAENDWEALLTDRRTWAVVGAKGFTDLVWWFMLFWTPDLFSHVFHLDQAHLGAPIALIYSMAALGALTSGALFPALVRRGWSLNRARKSSMLLYACLILSIPLALMAQSPWVAALLIGLALFAHQGFSTNIFGMAADIIPQPRVARVMALGGIAGNLTGSGIIWLTGRLLDAHIGYWPLFLLAASVYLAASLWVHLLLPVIRPAVA
jgi:MFS transporter, ACS family, hexuronate transporter